MDSSVTSQDVYRLGSLIIKGNENVIASADGEVVVLPKVMALLLCLCRNSEKVVTFDELIKEIWPREVVGDNAIYNLVGQLRKALGDSASKPVYIQTVSKVGYRLLVAAQPIESADKSEQQDASEKSAEPVSVAPESVKKSTWFLAGLATMLLVAVVVMLFPANQKDAISPENQRQLKLAYYQLYRGDRQGVDQAIDTLQQIVSTDVHWSLPKVELAYAFIRKARLESENKSFWLNKALVISSDEQLGERGRRLSLVVQAITNENTDSTPLTSAFSGPDVLISARLALGSLLFDQGNTQQASEQIKLALDDCPDCPYVYRKYASTQVVLGNMKEGFDSFSHYRTLLNRSSNNPADNAGYVPLTMETLSEMAKWHFQNPLPEQLLSYQRNALALFYLALDKIAAAEAMIEPSQRTSDKFFDIYTLSAIAGARGDFETSLALLQKRQRLYPNNERFKVSVVYALWQLGRYEQAMEKFDEFRILTDKSSLPDRLDFSTWSLFAVLLINTGQAEKGVEILSLLEKQLKAGLLPGSQHADIRLASVLALLGKSDEALNSLETAISQGWVSDFNNNWWYLKDSPYFLSLQNNQRFEQIVSNYHQKIASEVKKLNQH